MTLTTMRELGVQRVLVSCLRCQHEALIVVSTYWADTTVPSFIPRMKCTQCGGKRVDVRPNRKEQPTMPTKLDYR
jgi:transposase-like protein